MSNAEVAEQYEAIADWFDQSRGRSLVERPYLEKMLALMSEKARVLDLGCGMGEPIAAFFIARGHHVTGIDIAPRMIEIAKSRFPHHDWRIGDIRKPYIEGTYHAVLAFDSFFHLDRDAQRGMFDTFARHAAPGAPLLFNTGGADGETSGEMNGHSFHYASLSPEEYKSLLEKAGFSIIVHSVDDAACGGRTVWLARKN